MVKPCKENQVRNPVTNRCKKVSKKVPMIPAKKPIQQVHVIPQEPVQQLVPRGDHLMDVDVLFGLLETEIITFIGVEHNKREELFDKFWKSNVKEQLDDVCQGQISAGYVKNAIKKDDVSYVLLLKVNGLVVSYALLTEKVSSVGVKYMYVDVLCARKFSATGRHMLEAAENFSLRKGVSFTNLSSVRGAVGFYSKMGYKSMKVPDSCGLPNSGELPDNFMLDIVNESKDLISFSRDYKDRGRSVKDFNSNDIYRLLFRMGLSQDQIVFLEKRFTSKFKGWKNTMKKVEIEDYFDSQLLRMSKCLVQLGTAPITSLPPTSRNAPVPKPSVTSVETELGDVDVGDMVVEVEDFDFEKYTIVIKNKNKVFVRPDGEDWIFYDSDQIAFRRPTFGELGGNEAMDQDEVEEKIDDNVPVWIVDGDFGEFEL